MSRNVSVDPRYSEGELSDSPDFQAVKEMDEYESSLSLSEDEQLCDTLSIKPPQPQADFSGEDKARRHKEQSSTYIQSHSHRGSGRAIKSSVSKDGKKDTHNTDGKDRHDSKYEDRHVKDSRKEDLRERLERDRRSRKNKDMDVYYENRDSDGKRQHDVRGSRRNERKLKPDDAKFDDKLEFKDHGYKEISKRKKQQTERNIIISSPEEVQIKIESKKMSKENILASKILSEESTDDDSSSSSKSSSIHNEGSSIVGENEKLSSPHSLHEDREEPEEKRRKSESGSIEEFSRTEITHTSLNVPEPKEELPPYLPAIMGCRSVGEFQCLNKIEEGTYGVVYRAQDKRTDEIVALKRLKMEREKEGFPITSLREVSTLLKAQHENIVTVREIVVGSNMDSIFMVMDYVEHDLKSLMEVLKSKKQSFLPGEVKCLLQQLLRAVAHLHDNWILHRDLKTSNILLSHSGILKVGDFGLAREYGSPLKAYTSIVVTLWYRAPELLLGVKEYSTPIDVWSVGCIFGELLTLDAIFQGKFEADQINKIFKELGTPNDSIWPGYSELPFVKKASFTNNPISNLRKRFSSRLSELGVDLMQKFLTYDPSKRITAEEALNHTYLKEPPFPIHPSMLPTWPAKSEANGARKAQSPKPPSGGRAYKQLNEEVDVDSNTGFHMGNAQVDRRTNLLGPGFSLKF
ncbi:cyclin-dependent kinase 11B-like [Daphnia pulex]|nr:cyclin-dependent kinase 11B-like [Daphnia pulex]